MKRVGVLAHGFSDWGGGLDFLRLITTSLLYADSEIDLHVLVPSSGPLFFLRNIYKLICRNIGNGCKTSHRPEFVHLQSVFSDARVTLHQIDVGPYAVAAASRILKLDAMLPAISPLTVGPVPWVGYVYDFQHKHLPHFFTDDECLKRDKAFENILNSACAVIVNSNNVMNDIGYYFPNHRAKIFVIPFSPAPSGDVFSFSVNEVAERYKIKPPYFIICNQFWKHKDHATAFKAFAVMAKRFPGLSLVCTGATSDYRFPDHFDQLMALARQEQIAHRIHSLGLIPKLDQLVLLRGAVALIQPTLFEGGPGGGAVYDAVSLGQLSIVSDIPINREINDPTVTFFRAGEVVSLAATMEDVFVKKNIFRESIDPLILIQRGIERRRESGTLLLQALAYAVQAHRSSQSD